MTKPFKIFVSVLIVEGCGDFPVDMLRYDRCVPDTEEDAHAIQRGPYKRQVTLRRFSVNTLRATRGRWDTFGWKVLSEEPVLP